MADRSSRRPDAREVHVPAPAPGDGLGPSLARAMMGEEGWKATQTRLGQRARQERVAHVAAVIILLCAIVISVAGTVALVRHLL